MNETACSLTSVLLGEVRPPHPPLKKKNKVISAWIRPINSMFFSLFDIFLSYR